MNLTVMALVAALLAGCAGSPFAPDEAHEVAGMLAAYERLSKQKAEEQRSAFEAAQAAYDRTPGDATRLNLALMLLLPRAPWRDDARAQTLLAAIAAAPDERNSARFDFAQLLLGFVAERQRLQRDDQRKAEQLGRQLREERHKSEDMQQKLESLRAIDRELRQRRVEQ
jgi:hypothetical protein